MKIRTKRVYDDPSDGDGSRILVDRLWPRGLTKEAARIDYWAKSIAPSNELRRWYQHDPKKWPEFQRRYAAELDANPEGISALRARMSKRVVTLLFSSREPELNNATALKNYLELQGS
jgi:uncharacterized protein YeaO (DUF488 family)